MAFINSAPFRLEKKTVATEIVLSPPLLAGLHGAAFEKVSISFLHIGLLREKVREMPSLGGSHRSPPIDTLQQCLSTNNAIPNSLRQSTALDTDWRNSHTSPLAKPSFRL